MNQREEKISKLLEFPYDAFLMVRLEYVQILEDELEAKLLRIIEKYIEQERRHIYQQVLNMAGKPPRDTVDITKDIWVPISYRLFMNDLFGTVTSENTVKRAIKNLIKKKIIFQRFEPKRQYDAPEYKIHVSVLQMLLSLLKNPGYQTLIPSIIDTLKLLPPQELTPSECQTLIPSNESLSTKTEMRVSKIGTFITEDYGNKKKVITEARAASSDAPLAPVDFLPEETHENETQVSRTAAAHDPLPGSSSDAHAFVGATPDVEEDAPTAHRMPVIKLNGAPNGQLNTLTASASIPGEPENSPLSVHSPHSLQGIDGAATTGGSEPRASGAITQAVQKPLSLKEDEPHIKPETPAQRRRRIEQREKEIWALVEEKLQTRYSKTQRQTKANTAGMENLIEDETEDQTIKDALDKLSNFWRMQFDLLKFHSLIPGLLAAQVPPPATNGSKPAQQSELPRPPSINGLTERLLAKHNLQA